MKKFWILTRTEMTLSLRSFDMVFFGLLMPVIILAVVGLVYGPGSGAEPGMLESSLGAYLSIGICAVGLMGLPLVLSDYRHRGILRRLKVTPAHPGLLLGVQLTVQTATALLSALIVLAAARLFFGIRISGSLPAVAGVFFLTAGAIFSLGMIIASLAPDVKKAGLICSLVYFPMLLFSGTTVPFEVFPRGVREIARYLPLRLGIDLLNGAVLGKHPGDQPLALAALASVFLIGTAVSLRFFRWD